MKNSSWSAFRGMLRLPHDVSVQRAKEQHAMLRRSSIASKRTVLYVKYRTRKWRSENQLILFRKPVNIDNFFRYRDKMIKINWIFKINFCRLCFWNFGFLPCYQWPIFVYFWGLRQMILFSTHLHNWYDRQCTILVRDDFSHFILKFL